MIVEIMDRISPNNSRGVIIIIIIFFFFAQKWGDYSREAILLKVVPYFLFYYPIKSKNDHIK